MILCPLPARTFRMTQGFGERPEYYGKYNLLGHNGIDASPRIMGLPWHMKVYAPHDGYCHYVESNFGYGNHVIITSEPYNKEGHRRYSVLAHLREAIITEGQWVGAGDKIGTMGNTGDSTGIHLHWTYKVQDKNGITMNKDNGYSGAINIAPYALHWLNKTLI